HPRKQPGSRLVRVGARRLPGFDPFADEIAYELSKGSARIVEFFGLLVAAGEESFVECGSACRGGPGEFRDYGGDLFQFAHERAAGLIGNEPSWVECQLDLTLEGICTAPRLLFHPPLPCPDRRDVGTAFPSGISQSVYPVLFRLRPTSRPVTIIQMRPREDRWLERTQNPSQIVRVRAPMCSKNWTMRKPPRSSGSFWTATANSAPRPKQSPRACWPKSRRFPSRTRSKMPYSNSTMTT